MSSSPSMLYSKSPLSYTAYRSPNSGMSSNKGLNTFMFTPPVPEVPDSGVTESPLQGPLSLVCRSPSLLCPHSPFCIPPSPVSHIFHEDISIIWSGLILSLIEPLKAFYICIVASIYGLVVGVADLIHNFHWVFSQEQSGA